VEPVLLPCEAEHRFQPTPELLERIEGPLDGLIVASPSNPTGTMLGDAELAAIAHYCAARGVRLISDEIYHGITYDAPAATALALGDDAIVVNSFSKYYSMTGWRLGWMVVPEALLRPIECLAQNLFISPPTLSQLAGEAAFDCRAELDGYVARYARNRALLLDQLPKAGFDRLAPADGAFYIWGRVDHLDDSRTLSAQWLDELGIAVTGGIDFDPDRGGRYMRFSFAGATDEMVEATRRLEQWATGR